MMSYQSERDSFIATMTTEGVSVHIARALLAKAKTLHRIAELECSSEAADRDRVRCPAETSKGRYPCCCDFGYTVPGQHETVPRVSARGAQIEYLIEQLLKPTGVRASFQGDPRGCVLKIHVPSGKDEGWGGVGVPT
jgi:hypothetical protein